MQLIKPVLWKHILLWCILKAERDADSATVSFERQCVKWEGDTLPIDSDADQEKTRLWQLGKPPF